MDKPSEQQDAQAIEEAIPGSTATVEEVTLPSGEPVEVAVIEGQEPERPHDELEVGYRFGRLETRVVDLERQNAALLAQLAAFEAATVAVLETEQQELEQQGEVVSAVAEEVLPDDHAAATANNPEHGHLKPKWWEGMFGGHHRHG